jgi:ribonuclease inhibitor
MKKKIEIIGENILSTSDFHKEIAQKMNFPNHYGKNFDALWDCLTGHVDTEVHIIWKNHTISKDKMGDDYSKIIEIFDELKSEYPEFEITLA